jgi:hypothetical protein
MVRWEVRVMAGERWDLHEGRRIWEVWARGGGVRFEDEEDGWEVMEEGWVGVRMGRELVGGFEEKKEGEEEEDIFEGMVREMVHDMLQEEEEDDA